MPLVSIEQILDKADSKYRLVIIAAKRSKQLSRGGPPLVHHRSVKPTYIALEELAAGVVDYSMVPLEEAVAAGMLVEQAAKPTWFRDLAPVATGEEEEEVVAETEAVVEEAAPEAEEAPPVAAEPPVVPEGEIVDLESLEGSDKEEEEE